MRHFLALAALLACTLSFSPNIARADDAETPVVLPEKIPVPVFNPPPRVATTRQALEELKNSATFPAIRDEAKKQADAWLAAPQPMPEGYGGWIFDYACPDDGQQLVPLSPTEHQCPVCKKIYTDEKTIASYRCTLHYAAENAALTVARAAAYTGEAKYTDEVRRILVFYAHAYPNYPDRRDRWGNTGDLAFLGGRRYVQSLDEAVGVIKLAQAYDLTRTLPGWTDEERSLVEKDLFALIAQTLLRFNQDINNHQTWYDAGLMAIAGVLGDADLAHKVLTMRGGYYDQLNRSVGSDGLWYEGTMAYQNYALQAVHSFVDIGRNLGMNLYDFPKFKILLEGPLHAAYPNGQFPAINDSDRASIEMFDWSFQWGWELTHDPIFAQAMARNNPEQLKTLLGPNAKPQSPMTGVSENLADAGLAILRQGEGADANCVFLDFGQHGGGHGHFDKLNITLYANGREWLLDPGRLSYSHKEYKTWVKETAAHNTVAWNGKSQFPNTGQLLWLKSEKNFAACAAQSDKSYKGVVLRRYLMLTPKYLVDVYEVEAQEEGQADWFAHTVATSVQPVPSLGEGTPAAPGDGSGYQHLTEGKKWTTDKTTTWDFLSEENRPEAPRLRVWLVDQGPQQIFTANGIGYNIGQKTPTIIRRRTGKNLRFVTVYDLTGKGDYLQNVEIKGSAIIIQSAGNKDMITFKPEGVAVKTSKN